MAMVNSANMQGIFVIYSQRIPLSAKPNRCPWFFWVQRNIDAWFVDYP